MPYFLKSGNKFRVSAKESMDLHERLPTGTYTIGLSPDGQFFLEAINSFEVKGKLYGDTSRNASRILQTFLDRTASTGVLLSGEKGSGKTLLAKCIAIQGAQKDIPTIVINRNWSGESFNSFLQMIEQPTILLFDEYEKTYENVPDQDKMLTLLDGVYPSKKLFLLTCNDKWKVNVHMRNRPGRIYYVLDFSGLGQEFVREYCLDNLKNKQHIDAICALALLFSAFNFDMLKGMVEEMNRYNESPSQVLRFLNVRPEFNTSSSFKVAQFEVNGVQKNATSPWQGNPILNDIVICYYDCSPGTDRPSNCRRKHEKFNSQDLQQVDETTRTYVFINKKGSRLVLVPTVAAVSFNYDRLESLSLMNTSVPLETEANGEGSVAEWDNYQGDY